MYDHQNNGMIIMPAYHDGIKPENKIQDAAVSSAHNYCLH